MNCGVEGKHSPGGRVSPARGRDRLAADRVDSSRLTPSPRPLGAVLVSVLALLLGAAAGRAGAIEPIPSGNGFLAQADPSRRPDPGNDPFPQTAPDPLQTLPPVRVSPSPGPSPTVTPDTGPSFQIKRIRVVGSSILSEAEWQAIVAEYENRAVSLAELQQAADKITQKYLDRGFITSRAIVPEQQIAADGSVEIRVIEGELQDIKVDGLRRLNENYIRSRIRLGAGKPLDTTALENQLRLLRVDPLFENIEASLRAGEGPGQSVLNVRATEAKPFSALVSFDNYSPPSVGSERVSLNLLYRNLTGAGDDLAVGYNRTIEGGADVLDFSYRVPLNAMNGTLQVRFAPNWNRIIQEPFDELDIRGRSQLYEISFRQPFIRSPQEEFALSLAFAHQTGQTFLYEDEGTPFGIGPDEEGNSRTSVIKFGQDYLRRDPQGAWSLRSQFNFGTALLNATLNDSRIPDGIFVSWTGQVQRVQRLNDKHLLIVQGDAQLSNDGLLSSQQFVIGGGQSVRGFRQNARSADSGLRLSIEDRITLRKDTSGQPSLVLAPFLELGYVWNHANNPNTLPEQTFLAGIGAGLIWQPSSRWTMRLDYGLPLVDLSDRGSNLQDDGLYFSINYRL